jgi:prophage regulatory protein
MNLAAAAKSTAGCTADAAWAKEAEDLVGTWGPPELWRMPKVMEVTGLSRTTIFELIAAGRFPRPVQVIAGGRPVAWVSHEVGCWVTERVKARDAAQESAA